MSDTQIKTSLATIINTLNSHKAVIDEVKSENAMVIELLNNVLQLSTDISKKFDEMLNIGVKKPRTTTKKEDDPEAEPKEIKPKGRAKPKTEDAEEKPKAEKPKVEKPKAEKPKVEKPKAEKPKVEKPKAEKPKVEKADDDKVKNIMTYFKTTYSNDPSLFDDILDQEQSDTVFDANAEEIAAKKDGVARNKVKASLLYKTLTKAQKNKIRDKMLAEDEAEDEEEDVNADEDSS
jgi:hypothetical protein